FLFLPYELENRESGSTERALTVLPGEEGTITWKLRALPQKELKSVDVEVICQEDESNQTVKSKRTIVIEKFIREARDIIFVHGYAGGVLNAAGHVCKYETDEEKARASHQTWVPRLLNSALDIMEALEGESADLDKILDAIMAHDTEMLEELNLRDKALGLINELFHDLYFLECNDDGTSKYPIEVSGNVTQFHGKLVEELENYCRQKNSEMAENGQLNEKDRYNVTEFSYDWRLDGNISVANLSKEVERLIKERRAAGDDNPRVTIVAYSMGGIVSAKYASLGNLNKIDKFVSIGTPYLGSPKVLYATESGRFFNAYDGDKVSLVLDKLMSGFFKAYSPNMRFNYQSSPSKHYFDYNGNGAHLGTIIKKYYDEKELEGSQYIETFEEEQNHLKSKEWATKFYTDPELKNLNPFELAEEFHDFDMAGTLKRLDARIIVALGSPTIGKIVERYEKNPEGKYEYRGQRYDYVGLESIAPIDGDGTSPMISANVGGALGSRNSHGEELEIENIYYFDPEEHVGHGDLCKDERVREQVINILSGKEETFAEGMSRELKGHEFDAFITECPVELHLYDSKGNHVGRTSALEYEESINPDSYYEFGDSKMVILPSGVYNARIIGTGEGEMIYTINRYNKEGNVIKTVRFDDVEINPATIITSVSDLNANIVLNIDDNGDGIIDRVMEPTVVLDAQGSNDREAPSVEAEIIAEKGDNGWYKSDAELTLTAVDDLTGINRIEYRLNDENETQIYTGPVIVNKEGRNLVYAYAVDNNRNKSLTVTEEVYIDRTKPEIYTEIIYDNLISDGTVIVNFTAHDAISGVRTVSAVYNGVPVTSGSELVIDRNMDNEVHFTVVDVAGNILTEKLLITQRVPPVLTVPEDITVEAAGIMSEVDIGIATASGSSEITIVNDSPELFPVGSTVVTWT
ncbi:MAG: hypothetical protein GX660_09570, partial [Clostridiaceae bacterium]|nr:hypothetical protein [Clostridiaceae bacterium]